MSMLAALLMLGLILILLVFLIWFCINTIFQVYSSLRGAPYVPTGIDNVREILNAAGIRKGSRMLELGCGDGRILIEAVRNYGVRGYGVDINPWVLRKAKRGARGLSRERLRFEVRDIADINVDGFDIVYLFLLPNFLEKYAPRWERQLTKRTLFISHAFTVAKWKKYLLKTVPGTRYETYFYLVK